MSNMTDEQHARYIEEANSQSLTSNPPSSGFTEESFKQALDDAKQVRQTALNNAKSALEAAFSNPAKQVNGPNISVMHVSVTDADAKRNPPVTHTLSRKSYDDTKKLMNNFRQKMSDYPKHISKDGATAMCVALSMNQPANIKVSHLPEIDQSLINSIVPINVCSDDFQCEFDDAKDFILTFKSSNNPDHKLSLFNSILHPPLSESTEVQIEKSGEKISVGGKILLDKRGMQKLIGVEQPVKNIPDDDTSSRRTNVSGRNAYEIRADVLQMAIDWSMGEQVANKYTHPDDVVKLAKQFYSFVENRR